MKKLPVFARWALLAVPVLLVAVAAGWFWNAATKASDPASMLAAGDKAAIEQVVHDYILDHPEILPQAMANLQQRENEKQLSGIRGELETPFPGAILGNPKGTVTLVEFADFACGYCRQSVADVKALVEENPELRVVMREFPILSPESETAARMALAAAEQGKYSAFHYAMYAAGRPSAQTIEAAARVAGVDLEQARKTMKAPRVDAELKRNFELAQKLGFNGTPSWVAGEAIIGGAVGKQQLADAIAGAGRESR